MKMPKTDLPVEIIEFLRRLAAHNDREWFAAHKPEYLAVKDIIDATASRFIALVAEYEPRVAHMQPKDCTYRIYRDTRFSHDKTPYKTEVGIFVNACGKKSETMGWYLHLSPGGSFFAAGTGWSSPPVLKAIRQGIYDETDDYRAIVESPEFRRTYPQLGMDCLKKVPKGFPADWEYGAYLKPRLFGAQTPLDNAIFATDEWVEALRPCVEQGALLNRFYNFFVYEALGMEQPD